MWKYYAILAAIFAALTAIFSKLGVQDVNSDLALAIRVTFILLLCWGICIAQGAVNLVGGISIRGWLSLFFSAVCTGLSWLFYFRALQTGDISRVAPIDKLSVPLTILLAIVFLGETASWKVVIGGLLITAGTLVLLL